MLDATPEPRAAVEACRALAVPVVFVCDDDRLLWWKQRAESAEWLTTIPARNIEQFFRRHHDEFSPDAVYRAKTLGRVLREHQLTFVDLGLLPLVEEEVGEQLSRLIERNMSQLKQQLGWGEVTSKQGHWLIRTIFWLISGKLLRDKEVAGFQDLDLLNVDDVFCRAAAHYGTEPFTAGSRAKLEALQESARVIDRFSSLAATTTESLAYVYENALISKHTRAALGTHSTPAYLVDYIIGHLADWIEQIPENDRSVFEPACGHAGFLVAAMRLMTHLLPASKSIPSRRGPYLRSRLHGSDVDSFALELARLSLTLTDIPNPDGWDLRAEDMFVGDRLRAQTRGNTIFLANPPFANFNERERRSYARQGAAPVVISKAAEMLRRALPELKQGSVFGIVLPQTVLHSAFAADVRRFLVENFELREISLFPDKVFSFSDVESTLLIGRRVPTRSAQQTTLRFRRVRERQMPAFRETYETQSSRIVDQSRFNEDVRWDMRVPDLEDVWLALASNPAATTLAEFGTGLLYKGRDLDQGVRTFADERFPGAKRGFVRLERGRPSLHEVPKLYWMNLAEAALSRRRSGATTDVPQVLVNYAPVSRGPWRLKALIDRKGRPVASTFLTVRPRSCSLELLWALLNSPIANAYAFCHLDKRHNTVSSMREIPVPKSQDVSAVESAAATYLELASARDEPDLLRTRLARVDAEVLRAYGLPIDLERAVLDLFTGWDRVGVAFRQDRFIPEDMAHPISYADFVDFEADWDRTNEERHKLITKALANSLGEGERVRLDVLQAYADYYLEKSTPEPFGALDEIVDKIYPSMSGKKGD